MTSRPSRLATRRPWLVLVAVLGGTLPPTSVETQSGHCDPAVTVRDAQPGAYRARGDRCEGVYEQKVSGGTGLLIASLVEAGADFALRPEDTVLLAWTAPDDVAVRLRARSLRYRHYYRMDSQRPAGSSTWAWPADLASQHKLTAREIGLIALSRPTFAGGGRDVYVPIRIGGEAAGVAAKPYKLVVVPEANLRQVFLSVWRLEADGQRGAAVREGLDLGPGLYPAHRGVSVSLPPLVDAGYYLVEIGAVTEDGKPATAEMTFYHARR